MYRNKQRNQIEFFDYNQGFGFPINPDNRWVKLAESIPWDEIEEIYAKSFPDGDNSSAGNNPLPARVAFGALAIRRILHLSDRGTVKAIQEGPYLQYFLGMPKYEDKPPFDASLMVSFRKRLDIDAMGEITKTIAKYEKKTDLMVESKSIDEPVSLESDESDVSYLRESTTSEVDNSAVSEGDAPNENENSGTLIIDATCAPVNIRYPQDISLLNEAREKLEAILNRLCSEYGYKKPRTYCRVARKIYLDIAKAKRKPKKKLRKAIRKILNCVFRNLRYVREFQDKGALLNDREQDLIDVVTKVYEQQKYMYDNKVNRVDDRIVSIHMPFIRPIVRGKAKAPTEFGPKLDLSVDDNGYKQIESFSFDAYNEANHLEDAIERYKERTGAYPEKVLADTIYRNTSNRKFCSDRGIRMSGPKLGRKPKDQKRQKEDRAIEHQDMIDRIEVERCFAREKGSFGLNLIKEKLEETVGSSAGLAVVLDNLVPVGF